VETRTEAIDRDPGADRPALLKRTARRWRVVAVLLGLAATGALSWPLVRGGRSETELLTGLASASSKAPIATRVDVVHPERGGIRRLTIQPGTVHAFESADLYAKASGFLKSQSVDIGSRVRQGQVLAVIDAPELEEDVEQTAASLEQAKAQMEQAVARIDTAEAERDTATASETQTRADLERLAAKRSMTQKQFERVKSLNERNAVDRKLVDEHQLDFEAATAEERTGRAAIETAQARRKTTEAKVRQSKADLVEAQAFVRVAESRLDRARVLSGYTRIKAPFDGVVTRRNLHPGAFIRSAADGAPVPLLTVARTDLMRVVVQIPDLDVPLLDEGDKATVVVDALKALPFTATVARLAKSEDPTTRTMRAEIDLPNPDGRLVEGMYGRATIELQPPTPNLTIPAACVVGHAANARAVVFLVLESKARRTPITIGDDDGSRVEVLSGLDPEDLVVVRPGASLDDGTTVIATIGPSRSPANR
jgi:HlyD family secretion protein